MAMVEIKRSDGKTFEFGDIFRILSYGLTGIGNLAVEIFSDNNAVGDGDEVSGQRLPSRTIGIQSVCISRAANDMARTIANRFFNPLFEYEIHINYKGNRAWIPGILEVFDLPTENIHRPQSLSVSFFCPDPYFLSEDSFSKNIAQVTGMFGFPYIESVETPVVAAVYDFSQSVFIDNDGDSIAYPVVEIVAQGTVENPKITKDGLFVQVGTDAKPYILQGGDTLVIDFGAKMVLENPVKHSTPWYVYFTGGENIIHRLSKDSSITSIAFELGVNAIGYGAKSGDNVMSCAIHYNRRYLGV